MGDWTGTVPTHTAGQPVFGEDLAVHSAIETALTDAWSTWTPTLTNLSVGASGTTTARYVRVGKRVRYRFVATLAAGFSFSGGTPTFTLPATPHSSYSTFSPVGVAYLIDTGTALYTGFVDHSSSGVARFLVQNASGTYTTGTGVTSTIPHTWAATDLLVAEGEYEVA